MAGVMSITGDAESAPLRVGYPVADTIGGMTAVPLTVGQARSVKLIDDAVLEKKIIGLVASRNPELEEPGPEDCYTVGTAAAVQRLLRLPDGTVRLIVLGLERIRIEQYTQITPYLKARVTRVRETQAEDVEMEALRRKALAHPMSRAEDRVIRMIQSAQSLDEQ